MIAKPKLSWEAGRRLGTVAGILLSAGLLTACRGTGLPKGGVTSLDAVQPAPSNLVEPSTAGQVEMPPQAGSVGAEPAETSLGLRLPTGRLVDAQGAVEVAVTPLVDRSTESGRLVFEVAMNTHSVDLSMDLTGLATLETDNGVSVPASAWSGGGGHHVTGYLEFELPQGQEATRMAEAQGWILKIRDIDAGVRVFEWSLAGSP